MFSLNTSMADNSKKNSKSFQAVKSSSTASNKQNQAKPAKHLRKTSFTMPMYIPPLRGAPIRRVGGGTRSVGDNNHIQALSPGQTGLTISPQPLFYFYLQSEINSVIEFTLVASDSEDPLVEVQIPTTNSSLQTVDLATLNVQLAPNTEYQWFVSIVIDPKQRAKDVVSGGGIKYVSATENLKQTLAHSSKEQRSVILAESGIWYDAINAVQQTSNPTLQLNSLLEQVGLNDYSY